MKDSRQMQGWLRQALSSRFSLGLFRSVTALCSLYPLLVRPSPQLLGSSVCETFFTPSGSTNWEFWDSLTAALPPFHILSVISLRLCTYLSLNLLLPSEGVRVVSWLVPWLLPSPRHSQVHFLNQKSQPCHTLAYWLHWPHTADRVTPRPDLQTCSQAVAICLCNLTCAHSPGYDPKQQDEHSVCSPLRRPLLMTLCRNPRKETTVVTSIL